MLVDLATSADYEAVRGLDSRVSGSSQRAEHLRQWIARGECRVARSDDGEIVGFVVANRSFFEQCFIVLLIVHPEHRRRGVASAMIRAVETRSPTLKLFTATNQSNTAMQGVCESLGFVRSGTVENLDEGDTEIIYFKRLG